VDDAHHEVRFGFVREAPHDPRMFDDPLSLPVRGAVTVSVLVFLLHVRRIMFPAREIDRASRLFATYGVVVFVVAAVLSHVEAARGVLMSLFPIGFALGVVAVAVSVASPALRARFAAIDDDGTRALLAYRALFGALLLALAGLGHLPPSFALTAGLGDLVVGWVACLAPPRSLRWRAVVHGLGLADVLAVMWGAVFVVRPWSIAHGGATTSLSLPWVFVPFMFAMNLHGVLQVLVCARSGVTPAAEPRRHGSEPARRVRSALS
jgi:hypothetical protein